MVLPHEHLLMDFTGAGREAEYGLKTNLYDLNFELKNLGKIRQFPSVTLHNLRYTQDWACKTECHNRDHKSPPPQVAIVNEFRSMFQRSASLFDRYSVTENLFMTSKEDMVSELKRYREAGGATLCELTPRGIR